MPITSPLVLIAVAVLTAIASVMILYRASLSRRARAMTYRRRLAHVLVAMVVTYLLCIATGVGIAEALHRNAIQEYRTANARFRLDEHTTTWGPFTTRYTARVYRLNPEDVEVSTQGTSFNFGLTDFLIGVPLWAIAALVVVLCRSVGWLMRRSADGPARRP